MGQRAEQARARGSTLGRQENIGGPRTQIGLVGEPRALVSGRQVDGHLLEFFILADVHAST